jgi:hypothetical protein
MKITKILFSQHIGIKDEVVTMFGEFGWFV